MAQRPDILCIGSVLWDVIGRSRAVMHFGADMPGRIARIPGGVALNVAMALAERGITPGLLTAVGEDAAGRELLAECDANGLMTDWVYRSPTLPTDVYMAIEDSNGLVAAIADAHSLEEAGSAILKALEDGTLGSATAPWPGVIALDGNVTEALFCEIASHPSFAASDLRVASASPGKAMRLAALFGCANATLYVNLEEANQLCGTPYEEAAGAATALLGKGVRRALVTNGSSEACDATHDGALTRQPPQVDLQRVTGAGDTFMAAHIAAEIQGADRAGALETALHAAAQFVSGAET